MALTRALFVGDDPTPDSVKKRMAIAELLRQQGGEFAHVDSPLEAVGSILQSGIGAYQQRKAEGDQRAGAATRNGALASLLIGSGGSSASALPSAALVSSGGGSSAPGRAVSSTTRATDLKPHQSALLDTISGPESAGSYNVIYGGSRFSDYSDHPRRAVPIANGPNIGKTSSAAGRYQFLGSTWDQYAKSLGLSDFSPENQDRAAWALAADTYRANTGQDLDTILQSGDPAAIAGVGQALARVWTSLPGGIEQGTNTNRFVSAFNDGLGRYGQGAPQPGPRAPQSPTQVASLDPAIGMRSPSDAAPSAAVPQVRPSPVNAEGYAAEPPTVPPQPVNPQVAQMLVDGNVGGYQAPQPAVSDAMIAELLGNPWTEDLGQGLLQQRLQDNAANARLMREAQIERAQTLDERAYDASVRQEGYTRQDAQRAEDFQRTDSRNQYLDARQGNRDARADMESDRSFGLQEENARRAPTSVQEYEYGLENPGFFDQQNAARRAGAVSVNLPGQPNIGAIPPGYQAIRDEATGGWTMAPIPGGPAAAEAAKIERAADSKNDSTQRYGNVVIEDIDRAIGIIEEGGFRLPVTGGLSSITSNLGGTQANDLRALLDTVKSNSTFDRLQAMRDASPTGAALGAVSDTELGLLQAAIGSLDQSQSEPQILRNLRRVRDITDEIVNGDAPSPGNDLQPAGTGTMRPVTAGVGGATPAVDVNPVQIPEGIDPADWDLLTPEERELWR